MERPIWQPSGPWTRMGAVPILFLAVLLGPLFGAPSVCQARSEDGPAPNQLPTLQTRQMRGLRGVTRSWLRSRGGLSAHRLLRVRRVAQPIAEAAPASPKIAAPVVGSTRITLESNLLVDTGSDRELGYLGILRVPCTSHISRGWDLIHWPMLPILFTAGFVPGLATTPGDETQAGFGDTFGIGDASYMGCFSPRRRRSVIWGVGPSFTLPTATSPVIGSEKWSAGPAVVVGKGFRWGSAVLMARHLWSIAGASDRKAVNQTLLRPTVSWKLKDGWFLVSSPSVIGNLGAARGERWTVPVGMGVGKISKRRGQMYDITLGAYVNVVRPTEAPRWQIRLTCGLIFPKKH